ACGQGDAVRWAAGGAGRRIVGQPPGQAGPPAGRKPRAVPRRGGTLRVARARLPAPRNRSRLRTAGGWRPALRLPWLAVRCRGPLPSDAGRARGQPDVRPYPPEGLSRGVEEWL